MPAEEPKGWSGGAQELALRARMEDQPVIDRGMAMSVLRATYLQLHRAALIGTRLQRSSLKSARCAGEHLGRLPRACLGRRPSRGAPARSTRGKGRSGQAGNPGPSQRTTYRRSAQGTGTVRGNGTAPLPNAGNAAACLGDDILGAEVEFFGTTTNDGSASNMRAQSALPDDAGPEPCMPHSSAAFGATHLLGSRMSQEKDERSRGRYDGVEVRNAAPPSRIARLLTA